jgi:hypothetical protein
MRQAVIYLRVSTIEQTTANQERELREIASRMGCEIAKVYKDHGISGAKGRDKRPAFDAMCRDASRRSCARRPLSIRLNLFPICPELGPHPLQRTPERSQLLVGHSVSARAAVRPLPPTLVWSGKKSTSGPQPLTGLRKEDVAGLERRQGSEGVPPLPLPSGLILDHKHRELPTAMARDGNRSLLPKGLLKL